MKKTAWHKAAHDLGIGPTEADSYLSTLPQSTQNAINTAKRKDNPNITTHLQGLQNTHKPTTTGKPGRRSKGNPAKAPRAGAPNLNGTFNIDGLIALKQFAATHGGLDAVQHDLDALRTIINA